MIAREDLERRAVKDLRRGGIVLTLDRPIMGVVSEVLVEVAYDAHRVSDKSVLVLNDLLGLGDEALAKIRQMLFDDAARTRVEVAFGDAEKMRPSARSSSGFFRQLFRLAPPDPAFVPVAHDDPRHPCYFRNGIDSVDARISWRSAHICEEDNTPHRYARLLCYPDWEQEHGVCVAIRNGVPVGLVDVQDYFDPLGDDGLQRMAR